MDNIIIELKRSNKQMDNTIVKCVECGAEFAINPEEAQWYADHDFPLPKRCRDCRKERKAKKIEARKERKAKAADPE